MLEGLDCVRTDNIINHLCRDDDLLIFRGNACCFNWEAMGNENKWLARCTVSVSMSCEKFWGAALLFTIG
jgi:hypothetical protein